MALEWEPYNPDEPNGGGMWVDRGTGTVLSPVDDMADAPEGSAAWDDNPDLQRSWDSQPGRGGFKFGGGGSAGAGASLSGNKVSVGGRLPDYGLRRGLPTEPPPAKEGASGLLAGKGGVGGNLIVSPMAGTSEPQILNALRVLRGARGWTLGELADHMANPDFAEWLANTIGGDAQSVQRITQKVLSTGVSGLLMALTGSFPMAAMGYFASDRAMTADGGTPFHGWPAGLSSYNGQPILPVGVPIPDGLPNDIFNDFRFICFDRLALRWFPSDEVRPLNYQSNEFRWFVLDRVDGHVYQCNWIKKPTIYV